MDETIVKDWLCSLKMGQYAESFIDNGYDDLEICKQIDAPDLDAIGVINPYHRSIILHAVQILKVEGAASVYFTVEEAQAAQLETASMCSDPGPCYEHCKKSYQSSESAVSTPGESNKLVLGICSSDVDAYEAGKAELVRLPQLQLRQLLKENLETEHINLTIHPYTLMEGQQGFLEGLASRYADKLNTHYQDVLEHLEYLRLQDWNVLSLKIADDNKQIYQYMISENSDPQLNNWSPISCSPLPQDPNDIHPIYLPGKYNPSSCLSDAEEDQIYGFTGGRNQAPGLSVAITGCLNPRSEKIYELPPIRVQKKKNGLGKFLRTLKKDFRRAAADSRGRNFVHETLADSRKHSNHIVTSDLSSTPLVVLPGYSSPTSSQCSQSSKSHSSNQSFIVSSASAPGTPGSSCPVRNSGIQIAIEKLKHDEIKKRREEQFRDSEQLLKDIKYGLEQTKKMEDKLSRRRASKPKELYVGQQGRRRTDRRGERSGCDVSLHHWYDEPPYESDPEDFLICKEFYRDANLKADTRYWQEEDVISLKTAGDITLPRDGLCSGVNGGARRSMTLNPGSELQSVSSQLSCLSVGSKLRQEGAVSSSEVTPSSQRKYSASLMGRMRSLQKDMQRKVSRLKGSRENLHDLPPHKTKPHPPPFTLLYQRQNSLPVKLKSGAGLPPAVHYPVVVNDSLVFPIIGRGVAIDDCFPPTYDKAALKFKKGDVIDIISKSATGLWKGHVNGKVGFFKFTKIDELSCSFNPVPTCPTPPCLGSLLTGLQLGHLTQVFRVNGIETTDQLTQLRPETLDRLGITNGEVRATLLSAVACLLHAKQQQQSVVDGHHGAETSFVRRTNGRVTMPPGGSYHNGAFAGGNFPAFAGGSFPAHAVRSPPALYENTRALVDNAPDATLRFGGPQPTAAIAGGLAKAEPAEDSELCGSVCAPVIGAPVAVGSHHDPCHPSGSYHAHVAVVEETASLARSASNHE